MISQRQPYPGLRPFERNESDLFFGRDDCIAAMVARLEKTRFLAVLGSSGTGKSSLVKCGLLAHLEDDESLTASWRIVAFRPGGDPFGKLAEALWKSEHAGDRDAKPPPEELDGLKRRFEQQGPRELIRWCSEGHLAEGTKLLLVVDQFEELFRFKNSSERDIAQAFVSLLLESRWPRGLASPQEARFPIFVTITMRSEYIGACALMLGLAEAINEGTYLTPRMTREQCEEAIVGPALVCDVGIDERLVNKLLNDMADFAPFEERHDDKDQSNRLARQADQLPLMQYALNQMWRRAVAAEQADGNRGPGDVQPRQPDEGAQSSRKIQLKFNDYDSLEAELDKNGDRVFNNLSREQKAVAEVLFRAVTSGTAAANATRHPTQFGELVKICGEGSGDAVAAVIAKFGADDCQFLYSDSGDVHGRLPDDAWIDITHESLIRQWRRLSQWLDREGRAAQEWRRLKERAERGDLLSLRGLFEARRLRVVESPIDSNRRFFSFNIFKNWRSPFGKPTPAWAERYGGGFDRVTQLINRSYLRHLIVSLLVVAVLVAFWEENEIYQEGQKQTIKAQRTAITSTQGLLDYVLTNLLLRGDISTAGANQVLQFAKSVIDEQISKIDPQPDSIIALVSLGCTAADLNASLGNYQASRKAAEEARRLAETLRTGSGNSPHVPELLYLTDLRIGDAIAAQGTDPASLKAALFEYQSAAQFARQLVEKTPNDFKRGEQLVVAVQKIGDVYEAGGQQDDAMKQYQDALGLIQKNLAENPSWDWRRIQANTIIRVGQVFVDKKDFDAALEQYRAALEIRSKLAQERPGHFTMLSNLVTSYRFIADLLAQRGKSGDAEAALSAYQQAMNTLQPLNNRDPYNADWQASLALVHEGMANLLRNSGDLEGALAQDRQALTFRARLVATDPTNPSRAKRLATVDISIAGELIKQAKSSSDAPVQKQKFDEAIDQYRNAIAALDDFKPRYDQTVFDSYIRIGDIFSIRNELDDALKEYRTASGIALGLAAGNPDSMIWQKNLATSYSKIANTLAAQQSTQEAIKEYRKALEITTALAQRYPEQEEWRSLSASLQQKITDLPSSP